MLCRASIPKTWLSMFLAVTLVVTRILKPCRSEQDLLQACEDLKCAENSQCCAIVGHLYDDVKSVGCQPLSELGEICERMNSALGPYIAHCSCRQGLTCVLNQTDFYNRCASAG